MYTQKNPYIHSKEPYSHTNEPYVHSKITRKRCIYTLVTLCTYSIPNGVTKNATLAQKSPVHTQKSPTIAQKNSIHLHTVYTYTLYSRGRAIYTLKRALYTLKRALQSHNRTLYTCITVYLRVEWRGLKIGGGNLLPQKGVFCILRCQSI